jgi:geranylgeranyl reductase family protein
VEGYALKRFDVVVVGAGTAGCMVAKTAADLGLDVCLVDVKKREKIGEKVCGDAIGKHHFDDLGLDKPRGGELERKTVGIRIYSPDMETSLFVRGEGLHGYMLNRRLFGQRLLKNAVDAGATLLDSTQVIEPIPKNGCMVGVLARNVETDRKIRLEGRMTVDASGFFAVLRKTLPQEFGIEKNVNNEDVEVCYREIRQVKEQVEQPEISEIYLNQRVAPEGYYWIFSQSDKKVNVGLGVAMSRGFPNPKKTLYEHVLSTQLFEKSSLLTGGAWYVPTRRPLDCMVGEGILVVGDSACQVNPIHGGGMGPSMRGGVLAGKTIAEALEKGEVGQNGLWPYNVEYLRWYGLKQAGLEVFRIFLQACTNEDLNYGMRHRLITEEDLLKASMGEEARLNITDTTVRVFRGLRKLGLLKKLRDTVDLMRKVRAWYKQYPDSPERFKEWRKGARDLFELARTKLK